MLTLFVSYASVVFLTDVNYTCTQIVDYSESSKWRKCIILQNERMWGKSVDSECMRNRNTRLFPFPVSH